MNKKTQDPFDSILDTIFKASDQKVYHIPEEKSLAAAWAFSLRVALALLPAFLFITWLSVSIDTASSIKFVWMGYIGICFYILLIKREMFELVRFSVSKDYISQFTDKSASNPIFDAAIAYNQRRGNKSNIDIKIEDKTQIKITKSHIIILSHNAFLFFGDKIIIPKHVEGFDDLISELIKTFHLN